MSLKSMNFICFIIILVSTSFFSVATTIDGYIFKSDAEFFHKLLLTNDTTKTNEFSFTFCRDPTCKPGTRSSLKISFGSAESGASLISFKLDVVNVSGQGVATVTSMGDSPIATTAISPNTSPSEEPTQHPIETTASDLPEISTSTSEKTTTPSEKTSINLTVIFVIFGVVTFIMVILVSAVTAYFVLSRFSNVKPPPTASPENSLTGGTNKNSDSNISNGLHLCALTLISIVLIICVTILLLKFGYVIILLLCFHVMIKSDDNGVNLFLYFPIINNYFRNSNRQSIKINGRDVVNFAQACEGNQNSKFNQSNSTLPEQSAKKE